MSRKIARPGHRRCPGVPESERGGDQVARPRQAAADGCEQLAAGLRYLADAQRTLSVRGEPCLDSGYPRPAQGARGVLPLRPSPTIWPSGQSTATLRLTVLDPTCGESVFLRTSGRKLAELGIEQAQLREQVLGVGHPRGLLGGRGAGCCAPRGLDGSFYTGNFFEELTPDKLGAPPAAGRCRHR